jgi:hypothetical protein
MTTLIASFECVDPPAALGQTEDFFLACDADQAGQVDFTVQPSNEFDIQPPSLNVGVGHTATMVPVVLKRKAGTGVHAIVTARLGQFAFKSAVVSVK